MTLQGITCAQSEAQLRKPLSPVCLCTCVGSKWGLFWELQCSWHFSLSVQSRNSSSHHHVTYTCTPLGLIDISSEFSYPCPGKWVYWFTVAKIEKLYSLSVEISDSQQMGRWVTRKELGVPSCYSEHCQHRFLVQICLVHSR